MWRFGLSANPGKPSRQARLPVSVDCFLTAPPLRLSRPDPMTCLLLQFVERNRQVAHAFAGGMVDGVCDCRCNADNANLAQPLDAEWINPVVRLIDKNHLDVVHVGI